MKGERFRMKLVFLKLFLMKLFCDFSCSLTVDQLLFGLSVESVREGIGEG